jgi:hypothetical protein
MEDSFYANMVAMNNDEFADALLKLRDELPFTPRAYHNKDGDCLEILWSNEDFVAQRIDPLVTVYYGRESNELVGCVIKGLTTRLQQYLQQSPGLIIEVNDGDLTLSQFFRAQQFKAGDKVHALTYRKLRERVESLPEVPTLDVCNT